MRVNVLLCVLVAISVSDVHTKQLKFLFYSPTWGHSHLQFQGALADLLVDAGHIAHMLIPELLPGLETNGTKKAQRVFRVAPSVPSQYPQMSHMKDPFQPDLNSNNDYEVYFNISLQFCQDVLSDKDLIAQLQAEHYDVGFTEFFDYCPLGILHHVGTKSTALVSAVVISDLMADTWGLPTPWSYVTNLFRAYVNAPILTPSQVVMNMMFIVWPRMISYPAVLKAQNELLRKLVSEDFPDLRTLARNSPVGFINTPQLVDIPRPLSNKIVYIGGIAMKKPSKLSEELSSVFETAKNGVVLFSFGSLLKTDMMSTQLITAFLNAFSSFPDYEFIIKLDHGDRPEDAKLLDGYKNVHAFKWVDQVNILRHSSTKAFITHAGLNSLTESMYSGTPMICIPLFADQEYNTAMAIEKDVAIYVEKNNITADSITDALNRVLHDERFAENARILSDKLNNYPLDPKEQFMKWVEYIATFDSSNDLNLYGAEMGFVKYYSLDIIFALFMITVASLLVVFMIVFVLLRKILSILFSKARNTDDMGKSKSD